MNHTILPVLSLGLLLLAGCSTKPVARELASFPLIDMDDVRLLGTPM